MRRLVLASGNAGKVREFSQLLVPLGWSVHSQAEMKVTETDEPFQTFVENALRKARNASRQTKLPALADDSGICVPELNGAPGVYSARQTTLISCPA
jgi:XTP/dITP diphosphohydrolase